MSGLYVIVDPEHCKGRDPVWVCEEALAGGAAQLQLRAKQLSDASLLVLARAMRERCVASNVPFWVNDRLDIALLCEADGLHLGQDDLPVAEVRGLAAGLALGLSTHSLAQAQAAARLPLALIGFGPVFDTQSKRAPSPTVGVDALAAVCAQTPSLPVIAIGGIRSENAASVARTGARYAAVISAVCGAEAPRVAARALSETLREHAAR